MVGIIYFFVILGACILGAIVGLGGGVFIRPIFDAVGYHNVLNISFFSSSAILTMAIASTIKKIKDGIRINIPIAAAISTGAILGGILGNLILEYLVAVFAVESSVQMVQIVLTVTVLLLSLFFTAKNNLRYQIKSPIICIIIGIFLGSIASFLGIGGGPINVPILMILFSLPIKTATAYSIIIIFFSHFARLVTMGFTVGYGYFDLQILFFVIPAAAFGGLIGAKLSGIFSERVVKRLFQISISAVILLNIFNGIFVI